MYIINISLVNILNKCKFLIKFVIKISTLYKFSICCLTIVILDDVISNLIKIYKKMCFEFSFKMFFVIDRSKFIQ